MRCMVNLLLRTAIGGRVPSERVEVWDLLEAMTKDAGRELASLKVDGGASRNDLLVQFQSDVANVEVVRPVEIESTGRGAAMLAGIGAGLSDVKAAEKMVKPDRTFRPGIPASERDAHIERWRKAIAQSRA